MIQTLWSNCLPSLPPVSCKNALKTIYINHDYHHQPLIIAINQAGQVYVSVGPASHISGGILSRGKCFLV